MNILNFLSSNVRLKVRLHGTVLEVLSGIEITNIEEDGDGLSFDVNIDVGRILPTLYSVVDAEEIDISVEAH